MKTVFDRYPRQIGLFVFALIVLIAYFLALVLRVDAETFKIILITVAGGLIAELTGQRQSQNVEINRIQNADITSTEEKGK